MRISDVSTFFVPPGWLFVRVRTDEGLTGWGEGGHNSRARAIAGALEDLSELLVGGDPLQIERHWQALYRAGYHRGGPVLSSAVAAIDTALWDIAGQAHAAPIHELLGGPVRDRVRAYAWIGGAVGDETPEVLAEDTRAKIEAGYTAVKFTPVTPPVLATIDDIDRVVRQIAAVRDVIGPDRDVALDLHGRYNPPNAAKLLRALEPLAPLWVEEPVLPQFPEAHAALAAATSIPIATGERLYSRWEFKPLLGSGLSVIQPDVSLAGGISETRRIAEMCAAFDMLLAPHCAIGPVTLAASLQLDFALPSAFIQERGIDWYGEVYDRYVRNPEIFALEDGYFARPTGPGLGLLLDEEAIEAAAGAPGVWSPPEWTYADGSFAEW